jgi:hypothetical protein
MNDYTLTQKEFVQLKTQLTKAIKSGNHARIIEVCDTAFAIFEQKGYPDNWSNWQRAKDDALFARQRAA